MSTQGHEKEAVNVEGLKAALKSSGNKAIYNEAICSTAGGTAAKVTNTVPPSFSLVSGAKILVKFTYAITVANATLQVGTNAAKPIFYHGAALAANLVKAGTSLLLVYDGTNFNIVGDINTDTTYSVMGASGSTHASGLVPDTPSVAGTTKFLREDGTWQEVSASPEVQIGGNTPSSESDIKLFVDESADDTVEVYTKAQADGQFVAVVNMNTEPTESTLTYTATDGTTKNFKVGDEVRIPDAEADNGYTFYKLYALTTESSVTTATWDKLGAGEGGSADGLEIVAASGTTLTAEVGKYYTLSNVGTLAITLPTIPSGTSSVQTVKFYIETGASPSVNFISSHRNKYQTNWSIRAYFIYEITATWIGDMWIIDETQFDYNWINIKTKSVGGLDAALTVKTENSSNDILYTNVTNNNYWQNGIIKIQYNPTGYEGWCIFAMTNVIYDGVVKSSGSLIANWNYTKTINYDVYYS